MTREEAVAELLKMRTYYGMTKDFDKFDALKIAEDAIYQTKWIPVSVRLPEIDGRYLCCSKSGNISIFGYSDNLYKLDEYDFREFKHKKDKSGWYSYDSESGYYEINGVKAWMYLPEPY